MDKIEALQLQFKGLYRGHRLRFDAGEDPYQDIKKEIVSQLVKEVHRTGLTPNVIEFDISKFDIDNAIYNTREPAAHVIDRGEKASFFYLSQVTHRNFMLAQEFELTAENDKEPRPRRLSIGYAYPMLDGSLHMLLTETGPPGRKTYLSFSPDKTLRPTGIGKEGDRYWRIARQPFAQAWKRMLHGNENMYWEKIDSKDTRFTHLNVDKISEFLDGSKWNLIP